MIVGERETREMWTERYEKEAKEHTVTNAKLMQEMSEKRDEMLKRKNAEINLQTA